MVRTRDAPSLKCPGPRLTTNLTIIRSDTLGPVWTAVEPEALVKVRSGYLWTAQDLAAPDS